jgi:hypothetical protein
MSIANITITLTRAQAEAILQDMIKGSPAENYWRVIRNPGSLREEAKSEGGWGQHLTALITLAEAMGLSDEELVKML